MTILINSPGRLKTLEAAAFLGVLVPGESLVLVSGLFTAQGMLNVCDLIVVVAIGAILGDSIGYELGLGGQLGARAALVLWSMGWPARVAACGFAWES